MGVVFKRLSEVDRSAIIDLMNDPLVRRHMPLAKVNFGPAECDEFVAAKERLWEDYGYGPWAFVVDGEFAGWGGLQPEGGEVDLALVLHTKHWGLGKALYQEIISLAFGRLGFKSVTVLLPPTRTRVSGVLTLGFKPDGEAEVAGERFIRYRLNALAE
jgi:ribosomal-protein-alanine N-acetyltransferase